MSTIDIGDRPFPAIIHAKRGNELRRYVPERTCRMEAILLGEFFTGRKHVTDTEMSDEELEKLLFELKDDTVIRCSACHFSVPDGADVTYVQAEDGAWSVAKCEPRVRFCKHCGARVVSE